MTDLTPQDTPPTDHEMDTLLGAAATTPIDSPVTEDVADWHAMSTKLGLILHKLNEHFAHHEETAQRVINQ